MKKLLLIATVFIASVCAGFAQVSVDPADIFYTEAQSWEMKGLVSSLPQLRPYPANTIKAIISEVITNATDPETDEVIPRYERDVDLAMAEYERIFSRSWHLSMEVGGVYKAKQRRTEDAAGELVKENGSVKNYIAEPALYGDVCFTNLVSMGYYLGLYAQTASWEDWLPAYTNPDRDSIQDAAEFGPIEAYQNFNSGITFGTAATYVSANLSRVGYGPFLDSGLSFNDTAYHAAGFVLNVTREKWSYVSLFESIGATNNLGEELSGNKYLAFHAAKINLTKKASFSFYESSVFGRRFDLTYLIPTPYIGIQGLSGNNDNMQMGLLLEYNPVHNLKWATDIFVDDLDVEAIAKLKIKSKQRVAMQTGLIFAPEDSPCTRVALDYTIVMPYTYSHWEYESANSVTVTGDAWNYQNYTNSGIHIGTTLDPDSDRIAFSVKFQPKHNLNITFASNFIRHQNIAECLTDDEAAEYMLAAAGTYKTDGSIYMHANMSGEEGSSRGKHVDSAWENLNFMSGSHSMITCQAGLSAEYAFPRSGKGQLSFKAGYMFEYIRNAGVDSDIYTGGLSYTQNADGSYIYDGVNYSSWDALVASEAVQNSVNDAYDAWVSSLCDKINHYASFSVKYSY